MTWTLDESAAVRAAVDDLERTLTNTRRAAAGQPQSPAEPMGAFGDMWDAVFKPPAR